MHSKISDTSKINFFNYFIFFFYLLSTSNLFAAEIDQDLYKDGVVMNIADMCLKEANIQEEPSSEEESGQLLTIIKNKYGDDYYTTLNKSLEDAKDIYTGLLDQFVGCELALIKTRDIYNKYGLKGDTYTNALNKFKNMSNTLENKNESKYQDYISTSTRSMRLNDEHNKLMSYLVDNKLYLFLNELLQSSLNMIGTKFPYEREYNYELKKKYKQKYDQVLKEHDEWKLFKRDKRVVQLADSIPLERAYTETISERNKELSSLVATDPQEGYYEGGLGGGVIFNIYKDKGDYYISGFRAESITYGGGNGHDWEKPICTFNGKLDKLDDGWYQLKNNDIPSIFLLFADDKDNSAVIKYVLEHGGSICGHKGIGGAYHHISKEFLDVRNIYKQVDKIIKSNVNPTGSTPKKQVDKVIKSNVDPRSTSPKKGRLKLTDNLHNQFLAEDNDYALADAMLNATWKMVRKNLDKSAFASVQKSQREWASSKRDERAASYAASMPPSQAYTKVMQERIAELSSLVAREPRLGDYEGERQMFNISKDKGEYKIDGSADNTAGNTCMFEGLLTKDGGWYKVHEGGLPPYYVLFTDKGAFIQHLGSGSDYGCGANVDFKGEYTFTK